MLEAFPPRRDPRPLVLRAHEGTVLYAALDAWEVRGVGRLPARPGRVARLALARIVLQVKPSALVIAGDELAALAKVAHTIVRPRGLPVVVLDEPAVRGLTRRAPSLATIKEAFPEVRALSPDRLASILSLAVAVLAHVSFPRRQYAKLSFSSSPCVASGCRRGPRPLRVPDRCPARRSRPGRPCPRCSCRGVARP